MIPFSSDIDLGHDKDRMRDPKDKQRQTATARTLLERFFAEDPEKRFPVQVLADEVGMGKTFVALAAAYSLLQAMQRGEADEDLRGCYQRVLIITPGNDALFKKWQNETGEFVQRCVVRNQEEARRWFAPVAVRRIDELASELRRPGRSPCVLVTTMGMFAGARLPNFELKQKLLLGLLFRHWGDRYRRDARCQLLRTARNEGWPSEPDCLLELTRQERESNPFDLDEMRGALEELDCRGSENSTVHALLTECRSIADPRDDANVPSFKHIRSLLTTLYKELSAHLIFREFPLVIVDEAHNWKNGPNGGSNGYNYFRQYIAKRTRRALLLTATPFQLRPDELIEILKISDDLAPAPTNAGSQVFCKRVEDFREKVIKPTLKASENCSRLFAKAWSRLPKNVSADQMTAIWASEHLHRARRLLTHVADRPGAADKVRVDSIVEKALRRVEPELRPFFRHALQLHAFNADLSRELGKLVIRHRRRTEHRLVRVGNEFLPQPGNAPLRPDAHVLHGAPGMDVKGEGEIPHYVLMRCVSEMKSMQGRGGRSSLGSALTGCYSTLLCSAEGKAVQKLLHGSPLARQYLELLLTMVGADNDPDHPKVRAVLDFAIANWRRGEKTLIFCFRVNTADRLREIIENRIHRELRESTKRCLGGEDKLISLKGRLTSRNRDLIPVALDRVLWSLVWYGRFLKEDWALAFTRESLSVTDADLHRLAELSLRFGVPLSGERVDRVFLHRATEFVLAERLQRQIRSTWALSVLGAMATESWITHPYGLDMRQDDARATVEASEFDERGAHGVYEVAVEAPDDSEIARVASELRATRERANRTRQRSILDVYAKGANLLLGDPAAALAGESPWAEHQPLLAELHRRLWSLTLPRAGARAGFCWESRRKVMQAIRRAVLRESVLVRLLPDSVERDEDSWEALLTSYFFRPLRGQRESMAQRIAVFLEDLDGAGGDLAAQNPEQRGMRYAMYDAMRMTDQFVALVKGGGGRPAQDHRNRVFVGFNTPLLPEVLVCTQVGQEGIDLHRHCRHVVHYDLAWNPAVLEQRTGRADRIGSKTFRERDLMSSDSPSAPRLEVGVPFLAGTYDERMFEELRARAQTFEVLTGGDFAADNPTGTDEDQQCEGAEQQLSLVPLPPAMLGDLRVNLHVWASSCGTEKARLTTARNYVEQSVSSVSL